MKSASPAELSHKLTPASRYGGGKAPEGAFVRQGCTVAWSSVSMADFVRYLAGFARADGLVVAVGHPSVMVGLFERHGGANFPCTWCCGCGIYICTHTMLLGVARHV